MRYGGNNKGNFTPRTKICQIFYSKKIVLFPNETYTTRLVIDGELAEKFRELGSRWTLIHYDIAGYFFSTEELDSLLSGDPDPELEVLSGDETASEDNIPYCTTTITKTFTLSSDTPVFWRINGVAQVISSSETNSNDVYISPVTPTEEDFAISWKPEGLESAKAEEITLTISTIPGTTPLGNYGFRIETSEDGENWGSRDFLTIEAAGSNGNSNNGNGNNDNNNNSSSLGSSGGGCNAGFSVMGLAVMLLLRRRTK